MSASAILKLQKVGFTPEQVEAMAEFMDDRAVTKADVESSAHALQSQIETVEHRLELKIAEVKSDIREARADIAAVRAEAKSDIERLEAAVKGDIRELGLQMTVKLGGMLLALAGILIAAIRYLPPHP